MSTNGLTSITEDSIGAHTQEPTTYSFTDTLNDFPTISSPSTSSPPNPLPLPSPSASPPRLARANSRFTGSPAIITATPQENTSDLKRHPTKHERTIDPRQALTWIPPTCEGRTLVMCFDGTGDQFDTDNSNVVQLVSLLKKNDRHQQRVYYQSGVGTYDSPTANNPLTRKASKVLDLMLAWDLDAHVMDGYHFLMQNYTEGDKICIFGFSRGAYTARSLSGMLHKVGLLPAGNVQQVTFAYKMYKRCDRIGWEQSNAFKRAFSIDVDIEFLGVWDTVDSVGLITKRLPFTTSNTIVKTFRHAVSLDERRAKFKANLWNRPDNKERSYGLSNERLPLLVQNESVTAATVTATAAVAGEGNITPPSTGSTPPATPTSSSIKFTPSQRSDKTLINSNSNSYTYSKSSSAKHSKNWSVTTTASNWVTEEDKELAALEMVFAEKEQKETDVEEVWFAGCHCDVGGGSVGNTTRYALARIPLRWMIREVFKAKTGIMFDVEGLRRLGMDPNTLYPFVTPRPPPIMPPEHPTDLRDFICPPMAEDKIYDDKENVSTLLKKKLKTTGSSTISDLVHTSVKFDFEGFGEEVMDEIGKKFGFGENGSAKDKEAGKAATSSKLKAKGKRTNSKEESTESDPSTQPRMSQATSEAETAEEDPDKGKTKVDLLLERLQKDLEREVRRIGTEEEEELRDALAPRYDQLNLSKPWWVLEYIPLNLRYQQLDCTWISKTGLNRARPREIPEPVGTEEIKVHRSVMIRKAALYPPGTPKAGKPYRFRAQVPQGVKITYVD